MKADAAAAGSYAPPHRRRSTLPRQPATSATNVSRVAETRVLLLRDALDGAREVVRRLSPTDWSRPTACASWSTRDVLNHMVATTTKFSAFAAGETASPRTPRGDLLGEDPLAAFEACCATSLEARRSADLRRTCRLPFGTFTAPDAAAINAFDVSVLTWDLAQAANLVYKPSPALTALAICGGPSTRYTRGRSFGAVRRRGASVGGLRRDTAVGRRAQADRTLGSLLGAPLPRPGRRSAAG